MFLKHGFAIRVTLNLIQQLSSPKYMEKQTLFWLFIGIFAITAIITLLGITGVIKTIKEKYLNTLFTALILEVIAAVFLLFQGFNFTEDRADLSAIISKSGLSPPEKVELQEDFIVQKLAEIPKLQKLGAENEQLKKTIAEKNSELEKIKGDAGRYDQNFYSNIIKLDDAIAAYPGKSINIGFQPQKKEAVYQLLVKIFGDLGKIRDGDAVFNTNQKVNKPLVRKVYRDFRASYGRIGLDDAKVFLDEYDVSQLVKYYLEYRKVQPSYQARFNVTNN